MNQTATITQSSPGLLQDYLQLGKHRLMGLVTLTAAAGYVLAGATPFDPLKFLLALAGVFLAGAGANALNQVWEIQRDARMNRTWNRPMPMARISLPHGIAWGLVVGAAGIVILWNAANPLTAWLGLLVQFLYVLVYTPLKVRSTFNTHVGAVCGAIPPMMGWTAAAGQLEPGAWILAGILFIWQFPHFLALAWMHREDYARGGFRMLPIVDESGRTTSLMILLYILPLLVLGPALAIAGTVGLISAAGSVLLTLGFLWLSVKLVRERTAINARKLFLASLLYLPLAMGLMVADRGPIAPVDHGPRITIILESPAPPAAEEDTADGLQMAEVPLYST